PAARTVPDRCAAAGAAAKAEAGDAASRPVPSGPALAAEAALVKELTASLPAGHPALPGLLLDQAALDIARGDAAAALAPLGRIPDSASAEGGAFSPDERAQLVLARALAADARAAADPDQREPAVALLRAALAAEPPLPRDARRALTFRLAEDLRALGRADQAVAAVGPPPHGDDTLGRYLAFR